MGRTGFHGLALLIVLVAAISACGEAQGSDMRTGGSATPSPSQVEKHFARGTGHLQIAISPSSGPVGTEVRISATGCGDPDGQNHAVSFNPGFGNTLQASLAHYHSTVIRSQLTGEALAASYTITREDASAAAHADSPPPRFYVQCSTDIADAAFRITTG